MTFAAAVIIDGGIEKEWYKTDNDLKMRGLIFPAACATVPPTTPRCIIAEKQGNLMDKIDNTLVNDLLDKVNATSSVEEFSDIQKKIENAIVILHGDLRSIDRQIDQREISKSLDEKLGESHDKEQYDQWLFKIRRAIQYKKDQIRSLERALGNARDRLLDKRFVFVDKLLEAAIAAEALSADLDELTERGSMTADLDAIKSKADLDKILDFLDRSWSDWCD